MQNLFPIDVLMRWIHVGTVIVLVGGSVFKRFVLIPAVADLAESERTALRERVSSAWRKFVGLGIGLILISGLYNYLVVSVPKHWGDGLYHALLGTKMCLALVVFFLASALSGRAKGLESLRRNTKRWLTVMLLLAAVIVAISGFLRVRGQSASRTSPTQTSSSDS